MASPLENHTAALEHVSQWVKAEVPGARSLSDAELAASPVVNAEFGWDVPFDQGTLHLLLDKDFPYSEPRVVVDGPPGLLGGPHIELKGKVCIAGDGGRVDSQNPVEVVAHVLSEARRLLKENGAGENDADFQHDFRAYWRRDEQDEIPLRALVTTSGPSREIVGWSGKKVFVADDANLLTRLLTNLNITTNAILQPAFALWMERLPRPDEYPSSVDGLRRLVANSADSLRVLDRLLVNPRLPLFGVLMGPTGGNRPAAIAGLRIEERAIPFQHGRRVHDPISKGFRPGRVPPAILAQRLQLKRLHVDEVDSAKSRRPLYLTEDLSSKKVLLIGCGSLGSGIAKLLLQSGVREIVFVDSETIGWENIERHELGASSVGHNKAEALVSAFRLKFPLAQLSAHPTTWIDVYRDHRQLFAASDIVISTCANWNAEGALSDLQQSGELSAPVLYGWLEESALAAHALLLGAGSPCFRCGFSATGDPLLTVVRASNGMPAGCGGGISLYGAIDMAPAQAMIAGMAVDVLLGRAKEPVHRIWVCPKTNLADAEADWNPDWINLYGTPPLGGTIIPCSWPATEGCSCRS